MFIVVLYHYLHTNNLHKNGKCVIELSLHLITVRRKFFDRKEASIGYYYHLHVLLVSIGSAHTMNEMLLICAPKHQTHLIEPLTELFYTNPQCLVNVLEPQLRSQNLISKPGRDTLGRYIFSKRGTFASQGDVTLFSSKMGER